MATEEIPHDAGAEVPGRSRWPLITLLAVVASLIGAGTFQIPYYAIAPGSALSVAPLVRVVDGPSFTPKGEILLTTVRLTHVTVLEALQGWLDPTIDVVAEKVVVPPGTDPADLTKRNLQEMSTSKEQALGAAFEELGYDAVSGEGALVGVVLPGSPADGLLKVGETIVAVDGKPVARHDDAIALLGRRAPGDRVTLGVEPKGGGAAREVSVTLAANPDSPRRPLLGVTLTTRNLRFDFPFKVDIASDQIGGPSAGLAFALEVLDVLTEGELTGGSRVAATGTIGLDGSVGVIGGVAQKAVAVREAGAVLFLVPKAEEAEARRYAGDGLRVEGVGSLRDALRILATLGGNGLTLERPGPAGA